MRRLLIVFAAASLLQACEAGTDPAPPAPPEPAPLAEMAPVQGFAHQAGADLFGYYLPASDVQIDNLKLSHFHLGRDVDFNEWEQAQGRGATNFAPVMFQFDDLSSPTVANELGGQTPEVIVRVVPTGYGISDSVVRFAGQDPTLGLVTFEGNFIRPTFDQVRADGGDDIVLSGTLTIGDHIYEGQSFSWTGGD
ncbi:hypothetical protein [Brevundimonas aveniformis]|uniref:hypothetical protein n=1 Tax=Brevundimonas aveniformis TaxID=370977 RepID=UPI0003F50E7A|nr:hypothetical protein [Brevundimonas aveniformis]